jgi:hypothetical protein
MSNYTQITDFGAKDALSTGNPSKLILGTEVDAEFDAIATAVATKLDDISALSAETIVDTAADYLALYDNSATSTKKVLVKNVVDFIGSYTASATATFDIETGIDSTKFCGYIINILYLYPATDGTTLRMRIKRGGAYQSASYATVASVIQSTDGTTFLSDNTETDSWQLTTASSASSVVAEAWSGKIHFTNPHDTTSYMVATGHGSYVGAGGGFNTAYIGGYFGSAGGLQGIRFLAASGNITGKVILYGVRT